MDVNGQVPFPKGPFDVYNDAQEVFRPRGHQTMAGSYQAYQCRQTGIQNVTHAHWLVEDSLVPPPSCSPTTSSEPKLDPECMTATLNESLHHALSPICATTKFHHMTCSSMWMLGPYVTPMPNAGSILSMFNTPFNPHELKYPINCSQSGWKPGICEEVQETMRCDGSSGGWLNKRRTCTVCYSRKDYKVQDRFKVERPWPPSGSRVLGGDQVLLFGEIAKAEWRNHEPVQSTMQQARLSKWFELLSGG
ncbi:hypothetical protein F5J12DRAFT_782144 [Pisolithus orientalis]|uniref:uncharacterized protein n=1 Tax=Pisolithus orientalis TaxID=936130 RepID=UPI002224094A|nr:uncharacterized protein F5J12DRAFT_782144 [Pisolithus orientalis]KAI6009653.1 hypothetical protein F5J12DRAFT_782144 [Pisolithus orientalis]